MPCVTSTGNIEDLRMQLIKFCKPEHNIHRGAKLQLGTLFGYRSIENAELRDEAEGRYEFTIEFPNEIELDRRWCNLLFQGTFSFGDSDDTPRFPGSHTTYTEKLHVVRQTANGVVIRDTTVRISRSVNNCLIYCMSLLETAGASPFLQYKDHWGFPINKAEQFTHRLGSLIFQQAKLSQFDDAISENHSPATVQTLVLQGMHRKVIYRDRHLRITEQSRPTLEDLMEILADIPFVKPKRFAHENEYRFVFELHDGQRFFPPKQQNLLVTAEPLINL